MRTPFNFDSWYRSVPATLGPAPSAGSTLQRATQIDYKRAAQDQRVFEASLSSEEPVLRGFGYEVLSHMDSAIDLRRAQPSLPLLFNHNPDQLIGHVENVRVFGGRLRGSLHLSDNQRGTDTLAAIRDGSARSLSIGYRVSELDESRRPEESSDGIGMFTVTRWELLEASIVSVPADPSVGIQGRSTRAQGQLDLSTVRRDAKAQNLRAIYREYLEKVDLPPAVRAKVHQFIARELESTSSYREATSRFNQLILEITRAKTMTTSANPDLERGVNIPALNDEIRILPSDFGVQSHYNESSRVGEFSICRLLAAQLEPAKHMKHAGLELELSEEAQRRSGKTDARGYMVPSEVFWRPKQRDLTVGSGPNGASLVGTDFRPEDFINILRPLSVVARVNARILSDLKGNVAVPRKTSDGTGVGWLETEQGAAPETNPGFDQILMSPKEIGGYTQYSRKLLLQGDPSVEDLVRETLMGDIARQIDVAALNGTGAAGSPVGIANQTGVAAPTYTNGGSPGYNEVVDLEGEISADSADTGSLAYLTTPVMATVLKKALVDAGSGRFVWEAGREQGEGMMNAHRALTSASAPAGSVIFGNWNDLLIGFWSGVDILVNPYSGDTTRTVRITAYQDLDIAIRHPESFAILSEA